MMTQKRPQTTEYAPYYGTYVMQVPDGDFLETLETQLHEMQRLLGPLTEAQADFRYDPGKWSIKEVLGHVNDAERVFAYRLLRIARGDETPLPGFEQNDYVKTANSAGQKLSALLDEFTAIRRGSIALIRSLDTAAWLRRGTASNNPVTALAQAFILAGHVAHHQALLEKRYLPAVPSA